MIHFDGPYVSGFVVPQARDESHALKVLKALLRARIAMSKADKKFSDYPGNDMSPKKLTAFMRSIKRPWRKNRGYKVVRIEEMQLPIIAGYWLKDLITGSHLCNIPNSGTVNAPTG